MRQLTIQQLTEISVARATRWHPGGGLPALSGRIRAPLQAVMDGDWVTPAPQRKQRAGRLAHAS